MKHFVWAVAVAAAFVVGFVIPTGTPETETETTSVPEKCADAFYQLGAAHLVSVEMLLDDNLPGALIAVQSGSEALDMWAESCV